ncbi:autotransporter-associated beta strand repeat protein [Chthoniobacter flavus Ellin428]|uniref:Autotransporter-associated beta strand repeat protein n=1 Tax=Chthoniobacter flavus Ellin428 TaxID=497964 RepID=B4CWQ5_9BACT|nr:autotransporter-associated beta strand repeat-containing protein [Chthoniobacter flavus]EDY21847.1 autotransporter-associated beta strand repeat protein [Chthoniobacter flavus Ellin428]
MPRVPSQKKRPVILASSVAVLLSLGFFLSAQRAAADEYWDGTLIEGSTVVVGSTVPNGKGGGGSWDATSTNWVDATGNNPKVYDPNQLAIFSTIGGSITVGDNLTFTALRFDADQYTISTSPFFTSTGTVATLAPIGTATITATAGTNVTFNVQLVGTGGISVQGAGTVALSDDINFNTYSGGTTVTNGGTLYINNNSAIGTGKLTIAGNGVTIGTQSEGTTIANPITVTANSFNVTNTGGARDITFNGVIDLTGATRTIVGTVKQEQVHFGTGGIGVATETAGLTLTTSLTGTGNYVAFIMDPGNTNNYKGLTTITNGAFLVFEGNTADGAIKGDVDIEGNGVVDYLGHDGIPAGPQIVNTATVTVNSRGNTAAGEAFEGFDMFTSQGDTIGTLNGSGTVGLSAANLTVGAGNFSGQITNGLHSGVSLTSTAQGGLIKVGSSTTLTLSGANNYVGNTVIEGGTLQAGAANTFARFSGVTFATGGTLDLNNFDQTVGSIGDGPSSGIGTISLGTATLTTGRDNTSTTFSGGINGAGGLTKVGTGVLTLAGTSTYTGTTAINGGTLILAPTTSGTPLLDLNSALSLGGGTFQLTGISGNSTGQTLSGLAITGGNNVIAVNGNLGTSTILDLRGSGSSLGITRNAGVVDFRTTSGTLGVDVEIQAHQGNDSTGILGAWATVNNGAALAANDGADNIVAYNNYHDVDQTFTIADDASSNLRINTDSGGTTSNVISPGTTNLNTLTQNVASLSTVDTSPGTLRMGSVTGVGGIFITPTGGNLTIGTAAGSGNLTAGGGATPNGELILENNNTSTSTVLLINSTVTDNGSGSVSVTVAGPGITALASGGNSYTGTTTILNGTLRTDTAGAIPGTSAVFIDKQGTLNLNSISQNLASIADGASGGGTINLGSATLTVGSSNTDTTFSGTIEGAGSLTKAGTGALTLSGTSSSYSGGTTLQSGHPLCQWQSRGWLGRSYQWRIANHHGWDNARHDLGNRPRLFRHDNLQSHLRPGRLLHRNQRRCGQYTRAEYHSERPNGSRKCRANDHRYNSGRHDSSGRTDRGWWRRWSRRNYLQCHWRPRGVLRRGNHCEYLHWPNDRE